MERLTKLRETIQGLWSQLNRWQRISLGVVTLVCVVGFGWLLTSAMEPTWRTLYSDLPEQTASQIAEELKKQQIPYRLDGPDTISVPQEQLYDARLHIAGLGLTDASGAGYELFDEADFGMTAFTQKVNYKRALENELGRTIRALDSVRDVRVHLVIPSDKLFKDEQKNPSASVALTLKPGKAPGDDQIQSMRFLVSSAVEGLEADQVTIVDQRGKLLARPRGAMADAGGGSSDVFEHARKVEAELEERVSELLAPMVGRERLRAKVHVELDNQNITETAETYDPEKTAVRSEQLTEETTTDGTQVASGTPGIASNLPGKEGGAAVGQANAANQKSSELTNYEVSKTIRQTTQLGWTIKRVSVAVLLDESTQGAAAAPAEDGAKKEAPAKIDAKAVESLVAGAIGFNAARGDTLEVSFAQFRDEGAFEELPLWQQPEVIAPALRYSTVALLGFLFFLFVVRPFTKALGVAKRDEEEDEDGTPRSIDVEVVGKTVAELELEMAGELMAPEEEQAYAELRAEVLEQGRNDIDRTAMVLRQWIRTGS